MPEQCTCGTQLVEGARFCHKCGRPTTDEPELKVEAPRIILTAPVLLPIADAKGVLCQSRPRCQVDCVRGCDAVHPARFHSVAEPLFPLLGNGGGVCRGADVSPAHRAAGLGRQRRQVGLDHGSVPLVRDFDDPDHHDRGPGRSETGGRLHQTGERNVAEEPAASRHFPGSGDFRYVYRLRLLLFLFVALSLASVAGGALGARFSNKE